MATSLTQPALESPTSSAIIDSVITHAASDSGAGINATAAERDQAHGVARAHGSLGAGRERMALALHLWGSGTSIERPAPSTTRSATGSRPRWRTPPRASGAATIARRRACSASITATTSAWAGSTRPGAPDADRLYVPYREELDGAAHLSRGAA